MIVDRQMSEIAEHWAYRHGALERWTGQIVREARELGPGQLTEYFNTPYSFENVAFSHGGGTVRGDFSGSTQERHGMYLISGQTSYTFTDVFTDPVDIREFIATLREQPDLMRRALQKVGAAVGIGDGPSGEPREVSTEDFSDWFTVLSELGGTAYSITGTWRSDLRAKVFIDSSLSKFSE